MSQGKIHFPKPGGGTAEWTWKTSRGDVAIRDPKRHKYIVRQEDITGCSSEQIERAVWKQQSRGCVVTPAKVKRYIERELRKKKLSGAKRKSRG